MPFKCQSPRRMRFLPLPSVVFTSRNNSDDKSDSWFVGGERDRRRARGRLTMLNWSGDGWESKGRSSHDPIPGREGEWGWRGEESAQKGLLANWLPKQKQKMARERHKNKFAIIHFDLSLPLSPRATRVSEEIGKCFWRAGRRRQKQCQRAEESRGGKFTFLFEKNFSARPPPSRGFFLFINPLASNILHNKLNSFFYLRSIW